MRFEALLFAGAAATLAACGGPCTRNSDCPTGLICGPVTVCVLPPDMLVVDALPPDATGGDGAVDAGPPDQHAATPDGDERPDGGAADGGAPDAAVPDAGPSDGGSDLRASDGAPKD